MTEDVDNILRYSPISATAPNPPKSSNLVTWPDPTNWMEQTNVQLSC